jgi:hypothetical protein
MQQPGGLIGVLLNREARLDERHDAAMDLAQHDEPAALDALIVVASDAAADPELLDSCGESIAEIWARRGCADAKVLARLRDEARVILLATLEALAPGLVPPHGGSQ